MRHIRNEQLGRVGAKCDQDDQNKTHHSAHHAEQTILQATAASMQVVTNYKPLGRLASWSYNYTLIACSYNCGVRMSNAMIAHTHTYTPTSRDLMTTA